MFTKYFMARHLLLLALLLLLIVLSASAHGGPDADSDAPSEKPNLRSRSLILVKIWCLILVFAGTFAGGMSPYFMKLNEGFLVMGTQFAGGVFLGTALMHFLSDSNETFGDLTSKEYPFAFMLASAGYLMTMGADSVISYIYGKNGSANCDVEIQVVANSVGNSNGLSSDSKAEDSSTEGHASLTTATSLGDSVLLIAALCFLIRGKSIVARDGVTWTTTRKKHERKVRYRFVCTRGAIVASGAANGVDQGVIYITYIIVEICYL